ncbi:hypothetical protein [Sphingobacterium faecale]|uniref:NYN domain-containing protein n=1 Tax=Sphingobacterium faecale TaxID=2803775 RepID=A0ABS1R6X4_9SPHI|nr:hypothetical protein [Sphingobacterium faecale]MBL1410462.1 hypothetical protein [Sphingobacterium faecale]
MKNVSQRLTPWLNKIANGLSIIYKKQPPNVESVEKRVLLDQENRIPGKYYPEFDDYKDKHRYRHMNPSDKRQAKPSPLRSFPKKDIYKCFGWQLHPYDIEKLASYIDSNPKLSRVINDKALIGASEADILILTSGSGKYHMDSFLCDLDTSEKLIIIASVRDLKSVQQDISHRIDAHFNKLHPFSQSDFNELIDKLIDEATNMPTKDSKKDKRMKELEG